MEELRGLGQSFVLLFDDVAVWLLVGLTLSAVISAALPGDFLGSDFGSGWRGMLLAIVIGLPMYVCATASTPLAVALMEKGLSAGAALVFLLVGPATNVGTIGIVAKVLGKRGVAAYLVAIIFVALLFGGMVDSLGLYWASSPATLERGAHGGVFWAGVSGVFVWCLVGWRVGRQLRGRRVVPSPISLSTSVDISIPSGKRRESERMSQTFEKTCKKD